MLPTSTFTSMGFSRYGSGGGDRFVRRCLGGPFEEGCVQNNLADLSSPQAVASLIPEFRGPDGRFKVPNPREDIDAFLKAHQTLTQVIQSNLIKASMAPPAGVVDSVTVPLRFENTGWRSAEVGLGTDGSTISFPSGSPASYGGESFLNGLTPIAATGGNFYSIPMEGGGLTGVIYPEATVVPCISKLRLVEPLTSATWLDTYALGDVDGNAWLIVDRCIDFSTTKTVDGTSVLTPDGTLFISFQWADLPEFAHMVTDDDREVHGL